MIVMEIERLIDDQSHTMIHIIDDESINIVADKVIERLKQYDIIVNNIVRYSSFIEFDYTNGNGAYYYVNISQQYDKQVSETNKSDYLY